MKKTMSVLLVAAIAVSTVFASASIDARVVGLSAQYGVSYCNDGVRAGVDVGVVSPVFIAADYISCALKGQTDQFAAIFNLVGPYMGIPSTVGIYAEYDLLASDKFDLAPGAGFTVILPFGFISLLNPSAITLPMVNPMVTCDAAYNFDAHNAITARLEFPFSLILDIQGQQSVYYGFNGTAFISTVGYRYTF